MLFGSIRLPVEPKPLLDLEMDFRLSQGEAQLYDGAGRFLGTFNMATSSPPLETRRAILSPEDYFSILSRR